MSELIKTIPIVTYIILAIGLLYIVYFAVNKIINRGFDFKDLKVKGKQTGINHIDCPRHNDVMILLEKSYEVSNYEISTMKLETIREQMDYADHTMTILLNNLQKYFLAELERLGVETPLTKTDDFVSYQTILELFKGRLMNSFRDFCRQNHFCDMDEVEFINYKKIKAESLFHEGTKYLNELYLRQRYISREHLYELNKPHIPEFLEVIQGIINNARNVSRKNLAVLKSKKWELADLLESFVGPENEILNIWKRQHGLI